MIRFNNMRGWKIFHIGKYSCHLWYAPAKSYVNTHVHPNENIEILSLYGVASLWRKETTDKHFISYITKRFQWKFFTIKSYHQHGFIVSPRGPFIFLNFSCWLNSNVKSTDSSTDLIYTQKEHSYGR